MATLLYDGDKKRVYEVPVASSFVTDGDGFRIYTPNDIPSAAKDVSFTVFDLWSRWVDYHNAEKWALLALAISGGAFRYTKDGSDIYALPDLRWANDWLFVPSDYTHNLVIEGNIYPNLATGLDFDVARLTAQGVSPRILFTDRGERSVIAGGGAVTTDKVYVDTEALVNGDGSAGSPFDNIGDTIDYAEVNGIKQIVVYSEVTLDRNLKNFVVTGIGAPVIECNGQDLTKTEFRHCTMRGTYLGHVVVQESVLDNNFELNGFFERCALNGDLTCIDGGAVLLANGFSLMTGLAQPTLSLNGLGSSTISVTGYKGTLLVKDVNNAADEVTLGVTEGKLTLDTTCVAGVIAPSGMAYFIDNSNGSTVDTSGLISLTIEEIAKVERNRWRIDNNKLTIYDDDGVTVFRQFNLKDQNGDPTETNPVERDPI